jgi:type I restriction enzyme S subunit
MAGKGWTRMPLGELVTLQRGHDLPDERRRPGSIPVLGSFGITGWHDKAKAPGPGVTVGRSGASFGVVSYSPVDFWPLNTALYVVDFHGNDERFAYYFLKCFAFQGYNSGSAQPSLNRNFVHPVPVEVPPIPEQRAIAHILGTLDDRVELNRRMNETLEAIAAGLFRSWFMNFEPTRAKADGRDPCPPKAVAELFPDSFVASELGEIPAGWRVGCVDDEFNLTMGQSPPGDTYNETGDGLPFYQGRADFGFRFPTRRVYCTSPTRLAKAKDTLVSVRAPVGDINMALEDCAIGRGVAAARHKTASRSYSYQFMHSIKKVFSRFEADGTVFGSIGKKDFHAIPCVVPPPELVATFERRLSSVDDRIEVNERESHTLAILRDTLIPKLISGELRIKDAERLAAAAL